MCQTFNGGLEIVKYDRVPFLPLFCEFSNVSQIQASIVFLAWIMISSPLLIFLYVRLYRT